MSEPCYFCEVRSDVGCKHRPAEGPPPLAIAEPDAKVDGRISGGGRYKIVGPHDGQGHNFRRGAGKRASER